MKNTIRTLGLISIISGALIGCSNSKLEERKVILDPVIEPRQDEWNSRNGNFVYIKGEKTLEEYKVKTSDIRIITWDTKHEYPSSGAYYGARAEIVIPGNKATLYLPEGKVLRVQK